MGYIGLENLLVMVHRRSTAERSHKSPPPKPLPPGKWNWKEIGIGTTLGENSRGLCSGPHYLAQRKGEPSTPTASDKAVLPFSAVSASRWHLGPLPSSSVRDIYALIRRLTMYFENSVFLTAVTDRWIVFEIVWKLPSIPGISVSLINSLSVTQKPVSLTWSGGGNPVFIIPNENLSTSAINATNAGSLEEGRTCRCLLCSLFCKKVFSSQCEFHRHLVPVLFYTFHIWCSSLTEGRSPSPRGWLCWTYGWRI